MTSLLAITSVAVLVIGNKSDCSSEFFTHFLLNFGSNQAVDRHNVLSEGDIFSKLYAFFQLKHIQKVFSSVQ